MKTQDVIDNYTNRHNDESERRDLNVDEENGQLVIFLEGAEDSFETHPLPEDWEEFLKECYARNSNL